MNSRSNPLAPAVSISRYRYIAYIIPPLLGGSRRSSSFSGFNSTGTPPRLNLTVGVTSLLSLDFTSSMVALSVLQVKATAADIAAFENVVDDQIGAATFLGGHLHRGAQGGVVGVEAGAEV